MLYNENSGCAGSDWTESANISVIYLLFVIRPGGLPRHLPQTIDLFRFCLASDRLLARDRATVRKCARWQSAQPRWAEQPAKLAPPKRLRHHARPQPRPRPRES